MALIDKDIARFLGGGIVGAGAVALAPYLGPILVAVTRPLLKSVIRQSVLWLEHGRERLARATETFEDLFAEVRSELEEERELAMAGRAVTPAESTTAAAANANHPRKTA